MAVPPSSLVRTRPLGVVGVIGHAPVGVGDLGHAVFGVVFVGERAVRAGFARAAALGVVGISQGPAAGVRELGNEPLRVVGKLEEAAVNVGGAGQAAGGVTGVVHRVAVAVGEPGEAQDGGRFLDREEAAGAVLVALADRGGRAAGVSHHLQGNEEPGGNGVGGHGRARGLKKVNWFPSPSVQVRD